MSVPDSNITAEEYDDWIIAHQDELLDEYREQEVAKSKLFGVIQGSHMRKIVWQRCCEVLKDRQHQANNSSTSTLCHVGLMDNHTNYRIDLQHNSSIV